MLPISTPMLWDMAPTYTNTTQHARQAYVINSIGPVLEATLDLHHIDTPARIAHFLGQACEESDGFRATEEYGTGEQYNGRSDLGNVLAGDGPRFKGRGIFQLTGRNNYTRYTQLSGLDLVNHPELAADPVHSLTIACLFWNQGGLNRWADQDNVVMVTRAINGGTNGLDARRAYVTAAKNALARLSVRDLGTVQIAKSALPIIARDDTGPFVTQLQSYLVTLGYPMVIDNYFGPATELAARHFQAAHNLDPDGVVGGVTWAAINEAIDALKRK